MAKQSSDQYSDQEAQQRFLATVKAALNTPPKPLKDIPKVHTGTKRKPRKSAKVATSKRKKAPSRKVARVKDSHDRYA